MSSGTNGSISAALPVINTFWIGNEIGYIERLSMASFLAAGHPVHLHCYDEIGGVPEGVTLVDAQETVDKTYGLSLLGGRRGAPAMLADYFRLHLLLKGKGIWSDTDMVCLKPIPLEDPAKPLFGLQSPEGINNALLYLPPDSPIASEILAGFAPNAIPKWLGLNRKRQLWSKRLIGQQFGPTEHHWGTFGPAAVTALARRHGVFHLAKPIDVFYPYNHRRALEVFAPETDIARFTTSNTLCVHLWSEKLKDVRGERPAATSAIGKLLALHGL